MLTQEVKDSVQHASITGQNQYKKFLSQVTQFKRKNIYDIIKKKYLASFKKNSSTSLCKSKQKSLPLKQDCQLYARLCVACQTRGSNLLDFSSQENYSYQLQSVTKYYDNFKKCVSSSPSLPIQCCKPITLLDASFAHCSSI